jgi:hypothetical protein
MIKMLTKLLKKYNERLKILQINKRNNPNDYYPYDLDIKNTKEVIRDLEKLI